MTATLIGPPCLHCGLVTFATPCKLLAYDLEETAILGFAVECSMCKSKGPWASTPQEAIQRYSPWVSFKQRFPLEGQVIVVWDEEADMGASLRFSNALSHAGRYDALSFTYWAQMFPRPTTYHRVTDELRVVEPPSPPPGENVVDAPADATLVRDNYFDDDLPF